MSLDGLITQEQKMPVFTKEGFFDYIIELVICEDEVSASLFTFSNANLF